jgi:cupin 2 domain-containing protein
VNNIFEAIPEQLDEELLDIIATGKNVRIERIVSQGHSSPASGWYDQQQHEWVIVLQGEAVVCYESGEQYRLKPGSYLDIPAHTRHKVKWTDPQVKTIWLAVHYNS